MDESSGRFPIDLKAAVRKLGRFLLPAAEDAFLKLVQFGVSHKAESMVINSTPSGFLVHYLGMSEDRPASQMLAQLQEVLTGELQDRRLPLLMAVNYFIHHGAEVALTVIQGGKVVDSASSADFPSQIAKFPPDARCPEALSLEIYARTFIELDAHAMKQRLAYCDMPVSWKGKQLNGDREAAGCWNAYGQTLRHEYKSDGQRRSLEINVEVKQLSESERQGFTEVIPVQWGVSLDPTPFSAGSSGIRLIVPANGVETQLGAFKMKPCNAWSEREGAVVAAAKSVSQAVYGKGRGPSGPRFKRRLSLAQVSSVKFFVLMLVFDGLVAYPKQAHLPAQMLHVAAQLQPYLPYLIAAQILWIMWQLLIAG
ncbi:hypothetical protein JST97_27340 [bacterium]|nr:hypothetical protein [bacterium]